MLLPQPEPDPVKNKTVNFVKDAVNLGCVLIEVAPASQNGIELSDELLERPVRGCHLGPRLDLLPHTLLFSCWYGSLQNPSELLPEPQTDVVT